MDSAICAGLELNTARASSMQERGNGGRNFSQAAALNLPQASLHGHVAHTTMEPATVGKPVSLPLPEWGAIRTCLQMPAEQRCAWGCLWPPSQELRATERLLLPPFHSRHNPAKQVCLEKREWPMVTCRILRPGLVIGGKWGRRDRNKCRSFHGVSPGVTRKWQLHLPKGCGAERSQAYHPVSFVVESGSEPEPPQI